MVDLVSYAAEFSFVVFISTVSHAFIIAWNNGILFLPPDGATLLTFLALYFSVSRFQYGIVRSFDLKYGKYAIFSSIAITKDYDNFEVFGNITKVCIFFLGVLGAMIVTNWRAPPRDGCRAHHGRAVAWVGALGAGAGAGAPGVGAGEAGASAGAGAAGVGGAGAGAGALGEGAGAGAGTGAGAPGAGTGAGAPGAGWNARWYGMEHSHDLQRIDFVISCGVEKNTIFVNKILWVVVYVLIGVILLLLLEKWRVEFSLICCSSAMMAFQVDTRVKIPVPALDVLCFSLCYHTVGFIKGGHEASLYSGIIMFCVALLFLAFSIMLQGLEALITTPDTET